MGRSRGGLTTKIHALVDANGPPIALKLAAGQTHDGRGAANLRGTLGNGDSSPTAYDSDTLRIEVAARGAWANIKPMPNRKRRPVFSAFLYRYRNRVERLVPPFGRCLRPSKLKHLRAVAKTEPDKEDGSRKNRPAGISKKAKVGGGDGAVNKRVMSNAIFYVSKVKLDGLKAPDAKRLSMLRPTICC